MTQSSAGELLVRRQIKRKILVVLAKLKTSNLCLKGGEAGKGYYQLLLLNSNFLKRGGEERRHRKVLADL